MSTERELRPRRAPVKYHESDDDDPEWTARRAAQRARRAEADRRYRATHRAQRLESQKRYRARHRERLLEANKRYREQHRDRIREKNRRYFKANQERLLARQQRYRESHREELREKQQRYRESRREELREQNRIRRARFREKERMKKLMTLTIPLTDCRKSMPVTAYVQAFCDSLDAGDTNVSPPESFLQLLEEEDGPTLLDSETMQVSQPSDCNDLSFLQDLLSPDEWEQVMDDVQDFDVEAFVDDWLEDMPSSDEGVDLMYDLVS